MPTLLHLPWDSVVVLDDHFSLLGDMSIRRISWVKVQRRSLKPTKIAVGAASKPQKLPATEPTAERRTSLPVVSVVYGRLIENKETEDLCKRLGMTREDVRQLRRKFDDEDGSHSDTVTIRGFFHLINDDKAFERAHLLTQELLRLAGISNPVTRVTFDQFLRIVCTFASFSETQLWRFFYDAFFAGGANTVTAHRLSEILQAAGGSYAHNIEVAARHFTTNVTSPLTGLPSTLTFEGFEEVVHRNPMVFFPFVLMQRSVRARTLGEKYWERKVQEQLLVEALLVYLRDHNGNLPRMGLKDWSISFVLGGNTVKARARTLARQQYRGKVQTKA